MRRSPAVGRRCRPADPQALALDKRFRHFGDTGDKETSERKKPCRRRCKGRRATRATGASGRSRCVEGLVHVAAEPTAPQTKEWLELSRPNSLAWRSGLVDNPAFSTRLLSCDEQELPA